MKNWFGLGQSSVADMAAPCVRIKYPDGNWVAGQVVRLVNFAPERREWIADLIKRSEPCADPGDDSLVKEFDVAAFNPDVCDFNRPPPEPYTRPQMRVKFNLDDLGLNNAMDSGYIPRADRPLYVRDDEIRGGRVLDVEERWTRRPVDEAAQNLVRLFPNALSSTRR